MPRRYRSPEEDSARWLPFPHRDGDIVISTRSKSGTTWMQRICSLLVFQTPVLPAPLPTISPWLDWLGIPEAEVFARLDAQSHRRFLKTHTPLDGLPIRDDVSYVVVARDPLDAAVSLYHQGANLNRERIRQLTGRPIPDAAAPARQDVRTWLRSWVSDDADPTAALDSLPGFAWHLADAWARRDEPNIVLVRYDDLRADLETAMHQIAGRLAIEVPDSRWAQLVAAASFEQMRADAEVTAPDPAGVLHSRTAFFRRGSSGAAGELLSAADLRRYRQRIAALAPPDLLEWLGIGTATAPPPVS